MHLLPYLHHFTDLRMLCISDSEPGYPVGFGKATNHMMRVEDRLEGALKQTAGTTALHLDGDNETVAEVVRQLLQQHVFLSRLIELWSSASGKISGR